MTRGVSLLMVLLSVTGCFAGSDDTSATRIQWIQNMPEGLRLAKESGKPVMLFFTADWCGPCVELKKYVFTDNRVVAASRRLINISINADSDFETLSAYQVRGIPAIFFLNPRGEMITKYSGDRSASSFVKQMTAVADKHTR